MGCSGSGSCWGSHSCHFYCCWGREGRQLSCKGLKLWFAELLGPRLLLFAELLGLRQLLLMVGLLCLRFTCSR